MKKIDSILEKNIKMAIFDHEVAMPDGVSIQGPFYHGSCLDPEEGPFEAIVRSMSDYDAVWVSDEEWASEMFAGDNCGGDGKDGANGYKVVYKIDTNLENAAPLTKETAESITEFFGEADLRETIPYLERAGYDGWTTLGSMGSNLYTDIAIFREGLDISLMKVFIDGEWTEYFPPSEFRGKMEGKMKSDHLERFTRVMHV